MSSSKIKYGVVRAIVGGAVVGFLSGNFAVGIGIFAVLLSISFWGMYIKYIKDNPKHYWFKRRFFGWGWTPATWQGWLVTSIYIAAIVIFSFTIDEGSSVSEIFFSFIIPIAVLTAVIIRIAYKTGEKPRWQWGPPGSKEN